MTDDTRRKEKKPHWPSYARSLKREAKKLDASSEKDFQPLINKAKAIEDPYYAAMALSWIGATMADTGLESAGVFSSAIEKMGKTEPEWRQAEILLHITTDRSKTGSSDFQSLFDTAAGLDDAVLRTKTLKEMKRRIARKGINISKFSVHDSNESEVNKKPGKKVPSPVGCKSKITLGLYNTYSGKTVKDSHIRAVARAAPLCIAFDLGLVLFNFPATDLQDFIEKVESQTHIKETKNQITSLYKKGCISLEKPPSNKSHTDLGMLVATTSQPQTEKTANLEKLLAIDTPVCFLMGLGSSGLPGNVIDRVSYHLELTGRNVALETCTAMGVLAHAINTARKHQE